MLRRTGSTISSPLFVSSKDSSAGTVKSLPDTLTFIPKGHESSSSISSFSMSSASLLDETDTTDVSVDELQFNTKDGPFKLNRDTLRSTLNNLKDYGSTLISKLPKTQASIFKSIVDIMGVVYDTQGLYDIVLSDIRSVFTNTENTRPGTLEAFFVGCYNDDKFTGPMGCNPKCVAGLPPPDGTPGYTQCEDMVLIYAEGNFSALNEQASTHTYIYVDGPDFKGFSSDNIRSLREANISQVTILYGGPNGSYTEVTPKLSLEQLPTTTNTVNTTQANASTTDPNTANGAGVVLVIILIVIIILLLIALWARYSGYY